METYIPWYLGMSRAPEGFQRYATVEETLEKHLTDGTEKAGAPMRERFPDCTWWKYFDRWQKVSGDYAGTIAGREAAADALQKKILKGQPKLEKRLLKMTPTRRTEVMNSTTARLIKESLKN